MELHELLSTPEVAARLGVTGAMVRTLIARGVAHPLRKVGNNWLFTSEEVERLRTRQKGKIGRPSKEK